MRCSDAMYLRRYVEAATSYRRWVEWLLIKSPEIVSRRESRSESISEDESESGS